MGIITLTDRISVSVRAKNETESNSQKRATGRNIANALGNANISDDLADQIGNTSKPTITDENGNEWVSMQDIIDAGKKMQQNGAFATDEVHEGLGGYNLSPVYSAPATVRMYLENPSNANSNYVEVYIPSGVYFYFYSTGKNIAITFISKESFAVNYAIHNNGYNGVINASAVTAKIDNIDYSFFRNGSSYTDCRTMEYVSGGYSLIDSSNQTHNEAGYLFGPVTKTGGSLIDWNAPNAEIERQIKELHETWDVSEHEGAVTANGTYVLAGPIEYNDADPGSHSSGDF